MKQRKLFYHILNFPIENTSQKVFSESSLSGKHGSFKNRVHQYQNNIENQNLIPEEYREN